MAYARKNKTALMLAALCALVAALSLFYFSQQSLRLDEAQSLWQTGRSPVDILTLVGQDVHVPLYHELLHFWRLYVGDSVALARGFSLLFYLLSIPAIYFLGKLAYGRSAGLLAAALLAVSPFMNWYGGEIRMYTLFIFLTILNQYAFLKIWRAGAPANGTATAGEHAWASYIATAILGVYTHYFFFLVLGAQVVFYFLRREIFPEGSLRRFMIAAGVVVASFVPWVAYVVLQGQAQNASPILSTPTTVDLFNALAQLVFGFHNDHLNTAILSLWPLTLLVGFVALRKRTMLSPMTEYFALSVLLPVAVVFAASIFVPLFVSRYLIFTVPSLYLVLVSLASSYPGVAGVWARRALVGIMVLMLAVEMTSPTAPVKEHYREAAAFLSEHAGAQDVIVLSAPFTVYPVEYYYRGEAALTTIPQWDRYVFGPIPEFDPSALPQEVTDVAEEHQDVWLLLSYDQGYQEEVKSYFDNNFEKLSETNFSPGLDLYRYKVRYDTPLGRSTSTGEALSELGLAH